MTQHFVETSGVQPQLFVFEQNYLYTTDTQKESHCFEIFLKNFEDNFDTQQNHSWTKYWERESEKIVLQQWELKYGDYLANTTEQCNVWQDTNNLQIYKELEEKNDTVTIDEQEQKNTESWQELWQQHAEEVYFEQYILYTSIYYNFYLDFKKSIQSCLEDKHREDEVESKEEEKNQKSQEDIVAELQQLQLLGLPTAFGGRPQQNRKIRNGNAIQYFSDYFSDADEDEIPEINSDKMEMIETITDNDTTLHKVQNKEISKRKKNRKLRNVPEFLLQEKGLLKYWRMRFSLFSRFDEGIRLDRESWFSVTPEKVATHLADRLSCDVLIDGFCGCGGNAIQFARTCRKVIAIDIDPLKLEMAKHNATIYGVADKIDFIVGDYLQLSGSGQLRGDIVFLSPPWGGPKYKKKQDYDVERFLIPVGATELMQHSRKVSTNIAIFLPRNSNMQQIIKLAGIGKRCEVEHNYLDSRLVAITALYGEDILSKQIDAESK